MYDEACAMAVVVVGEVTHLGESTFFFADIIAAEFEEQDIQYAGAVRRGPDAAEAMVVHWATLWVLCYACAPQSAVIYYDSTSAGKATEGLHSAGPNIELVTRATRGIVHTPEAKSIPVAF